MTYRAHNFTDRQKLAIFENAKGRCQGCDCKLMPGRWDADHILPVALGGESDVANGQALCLACHPEKTKGDRQRISKAIRTAKKHNGIKRSSRPMPGSKGSGWRKRFNGDVRFIDE